MAVRKSTSLGITLALTLYLLLSLTFLKLPGLQYDEVNFVNASMGRANAQFVIWAPRLFGRRLPLMIMDYIGAVKSVLYAPIFKVFGTSATTVRLPVVCIGLVTLLTSYALLRRMFDDLRIAVIGLLLFATDPTFVFGNKLDWGPVSLMLLLEVSSLYFMWRWMQEGKRYFLVIAGFFFGLGLYNKIIFSWYLAAFFIALLLFFRANIKRLLSRRALVWFLAAWLAGCIPLVGFNIVNHMETFKHQEVMKFPGIETLKQRYALFRGTLDAQGVYFLVTRGQVEDMAGIPKNGSSEKGDLLMRMIAGFSWVRRSPMPLALAGSLVLILILWTLGRLSKTREILFLTTQLVIIAAFICLTPKANGAHHVLAFYPFVFIVIAFAVCELGDWLGKSRTRASVVTGLCLSPLLLAQLVVDARYLQSFRASGGVGYWSDAIYELASFVDKNPDKNFVLMEWGFSNQLMLLSNGRIRYEDFICDDGNLESCIEPLLSHPKAVTIFYAPPYGNLAVLDAYNEALARHHLQVKAQTFFQRDGRPVYLVYDTDKMTRP